MCLVVKATFQAEGSQFFICGIFSELEKIIHPPDSGNLSMLDKRFGSHAHCICVKRDFSFEHVGQFFRVIAHITHRIHALLDDAGGTAVRVNGCSSGHGAE